MTASGPPPPASRTAVTAHRYAPFMAVVLAQLVLVAIAPSKSAPEQIPTFSAPPVASAGPGVPTAGPLPTTTASSVPRSIVTAGPLPRNTAGAVAVPGAPAAGDTRHCVKGRQFGDFEAAPPCVPVFTGNNGGATYRGATAKTVKVVYFRKKDNAVVEGIRASQGLHADEGDQRRFMAAFQKFANSRYELYGRTAQIVLWQSPCGTAPPEIQCFRTDARNLVSKEKPFAVVYDDNTNTPEFFDELSKLGVVNIGGWHFTDSFSKARRPFHYDLQMGGDFQADLAGEYWCKKLAGATGPLRRRHHDAQEDPQGRRALPADRRQPRAGAAACSGSSAAAAPRSSTCPTHPTPVRRTSRPPHKWLGPRQRA